MGQSCTAVNRNAPPTLVSKCLKHVEAKSITLFVLGILAEVATLSLYLNGVISGNVATAMAVGNLAFFLAAKLCDFAFSQVKEKRVDRQVHRERSSGSGARRSLMAALDAAAMGTSSGNGSASDRSGERSPPIKTPEVRSQSQSPSPSYLAFPASGYVSAPPESVHVSDLMPLAAPQPQPPGGAARTMTAEAPFVAPAAAVSGGNARGVVGTAPGNLVRGPAAKLKASPANLASHHHTRAASHHSPHGRAVTTRPCENEPPGVREARPSSSPTKRRETDLHVKIKNPRDLNGGADAYIGSRKADFEVQDSHGMTPFLLTVELYANNHKFTKYLTYATLLQKHGANVSAAFRKRNALEMLYEKNRKLTSAYSQFAYAPMVKFLTEVCRLVSQRREVMQWVAAQQNAPQSTASSSRGSSRRSSQSFA